MQRSVLPLNCKPEQNTTLSSMLEKLNSDIHMEFEVARLDPLFKDQAEYDTFRARHDGHNVKTGDLSTYEGNCYLGIDAGSTTTKIARRRGRFPVVFILQQQQRKPAFHCDPFHQGDLRKTSGKCTYRTLLLYRLR